MHTLCTIVYTCTQQHYPYLLCQLEYLTMYSVCGATRSLHKVNVNTRGKEAAKIA